MQAKTLSFYLVLATMLIGVVGYAPVAPVTPVHEISANALTSGSIGGLNYTYGTKTYFDSGNMTRNLNGTITETHNRTSTFVRTLPLVKNITLSNYIYKIDWNKTIGTSVANETQYFNNETFTYFVHTYLMKIVAARFNPKNYTDGFVQMKMNFTDHYRTSVTVAISTKGDFLGQFPANNSYVEFFFKYANGTQALWKGVLSVAAVIFKVDTVLTQVKGTRTKYSAAYMAYGVRHSVAYNVSATAHQVTITNGKNMGLHVTMFDNIKANYTEYTVGYVAYSLVYADFTQLKFMNGTPVDPGMYPRELLPVTSTATGSFVEAGYSSYKSTIKSTFQSITSLFATKSKTSTPNSTTISARLAVWGVSTIPVMAAYTDGNLNGQLDLALTQNGPSIASSDRINYLGLAEAYHVDAVNARYKEVNSTSTTTLWGYGGLNITDTVHRNQTRFNTESYGYGNLTASTSTMKWTAPVQKTNGDVVFNFGVDYNNFPVTWVNTTNATNSFIDYENMSYDYKVTVNPTTGRATVSPTWTYSGIRDSTKKGAFSGLSLATVTRSDFFALSAVYTATGANTNVTSSQQESFATINVKAGGGTATELNVTGAKQKYNLNGTTYNATFGVINLVQVSGNFGGSSVSPFSSQSDQTGGTSQVNTLVQSLKGKFFYKSDLVIVNYPTWDGKNLVHDPDYSVNYQPQAQPTATPTPTPTPTQTPTGTSTPTKSAAPSVSPSVGAPFLLLPFILGLGVIVIYRRRK